MDLPPTEIGAGDGSKNKEKKPNTNPLMDPYLLEKVFSFMRVKELKNCRLVNSEWCNEATPFLRKAMVYFDGHYDEEDDIPEDRENHDSWYRDVKNFMRNPFLCENYCLSKGAKYTEQLHDIREFFKKFGPAIKTLRLDYEFHSHFDVQLIQNFIREDLKNLECLDIRNMPLVIGRMTRHHQIQEIVNNCEGQDLSDGLPVFLLKKNGPHPTFPSIKRVEIWNYNSYVGEMGRNFVKDLLRVAPSLECIKVVDRYHKNIAQFFLEEIRDNPLYASNLKEVHLDCASSPSVEDLGILSELKRNLRVLRLGKLPEMKSASEITYFQNLLNNQSKSLVELQFANFRGASVAISIPNFPKLKKFELTQDVPNAKTFNVTFVPINYKEQMPVLEVLANCRNKITYPYDEYDYEMHEEKVNFFKGMGSLWKSIFPDDGQVCKSLRILDIQFPKDPQANITKRLAKLFPEVNHPKLNQARI